MSLRCLLCGEAAHHRSLWRLHPQGERCSGLCLQESARLTPSWFSAALLGSCAWLRVLPGSLFKLSTARGGHTAVAGCVSAAFLSDVNCNMVPQQGPGHLSTVRSSTVQEGQPHSHSRHTLGVLGAFAGDKSFMPPPPLRMVTCGPSAILL